MSKLRTYRGMTSRVETGNQCTEIYYNDMLHSIRVPIQDHWAGHYRVVYDSKYVTLYGWDLNYQIAGWLSPKIEYEEMVLEPCLIEVRDMIPYINEVTDTEIVILFTPVENCLK